MTRPARKPRQPASSAASSTLGVMTSQSGSNWERITDNPSASTSLTPEDDRRTGSITTFGGLAAQE